MQKSSPDTSTSPASPPLSSPDPVAPPVSNASGRDYWRSLEDYTRTPEFDAMVQREFPSVAPDVATDASRRSFLKVMGASLALAGFTGCRWPEEKILPFSDRPEGRIPGVPVFYATAMEIGGVARGLLAKSFDGRPIKIEGNPEHPESQGSSDILSQSAILEMYDPDRAQKVIERKGGGEFTHDWTAFDTTVRGIADRMRSLGGQGVAILAEASSSPTLARLRAEWSASMPQSRWYEYESVSRDNEWAGTKLAFGQAYRPHFQYDKAQVIVSFDDDFLVSHPVAVRYAFDFVQGRQPRNHSFNRLYMVEPTLSPTGGMADHRLPVAPSQVATVATELAAELFLGQHLSHGAVTGALQTRLESVRASGKHAAFVKQMAKDLMAHRSATIVTAGIRQSSEVHALVHLINDALGNVGSTVTYSREIDADRPSHADAIRDLTAEMYAGRVSTLIILGGNPVFDAPADLDFAAALPKVGESIHLTTYDNETSSHCTWTVPRAHFLESWGDARGFDGTVSIVQPVIRPLFGGLSAIELMATLLGRVADKGYDLVRETLQANSGLGVDVDASWRSILHDGVIPGTSFHRESPTVDTFGISAGLAGVGSHAASTDSGSLELVFAADPAIYDGRFANNGWLQELPDSLSKIAWDNAALLAPRTAKELGVTNGDVLHLEKDGRSIEIAAWVQPGIAQHTAVIFLGYGRTHSGNVGTGVGVDPHPLRTSSDRDMALGVAVTRTGEIYEIHSTQDHYPIDEVGADATAARLSSLVRESTIDEYLHGGHEDHGHHPPPTPLWEAPAAYDGYKWGLAIDLNTCTSCNACVLACQSENNIPVVGREEVGRGREMSWIRIDRYYRGDMDDPQLVTQPVACQHCENAPCEQVCPVAATVHSQEGLNEMVYNRCIGTRYCANNCPYKVRRFNFFNYNGGMSSLEKMRPNPDVTMRSRGVMEKCSFCIQRIAGVRIEAKNEKRRIHDGEIVTACQQACPTRAITFGDLNDPKSEVTAKHADDRAYGMLGDFLYTKPRLHYLKRLRNPAAGFAGAHGTKVDDHGADGGH